jgi:KaiC/GvpD/RAD55 family RecA-like ATPase
MADLSKLISFAQTFHFERTNLHSDSHDHSRWIDKGENRWIALEYLKSYGWEVVNEESDKFLVKRPNSTNPHSGTCWKETGAIWLWSSGATGLDEQRSYSPWDIYQMNKPIKAELKTKPKNAYEFSQMNDYLEATLSLPKLTYMMDGYICLGQLTFLFGPEKVGKTPIAMEMALNMAKGEKHFGHFRNDAGPVPTLYLDNELQARNLRKRFSSDEEQLMLHKFPDNFYRLQPDKAITGLMSDKEIMDATLEAIEDARINSNIQFVVIDNMAPLIEDEEKATNAKKFISQLIAYADKTDVGILVIQHVTKQYESQILRTSAMRGSGRLKDMAAGLIGVNVNGHTGQRYLKFFPSRNVEEAESQVLKFKTVKPESLIVIETQGWEQEEVIIQERGEGELLDEIFNLEHVDIGSAFIRLKRDGHKADDIAEQLGCSRQHLYDCKKVYEKWEKQNIDNKAIRDKVLSLSPIPGDSVL